MVKRTKISANHCTCDRCSHEWDSLGERLPVICPNCRTRQWNGTRKVGRPVGARDASKANLPKPHRPRSL